MLFFQGRLVINKGVREFIDAAKTLKKEFPTWNFIIYGHQIIKVMMKLTLKNTKMKLKTRL